MIVDKTYGSKQRDYLDPITDRQVRQFTDLSAEEYHLYFYNPSVMPDGKYSIFFSERTRVSNL